MADKIPDCDHDFIFTTPLHQYPLAVTLNAALRISLIKKGESHNSYIIEDDNESEFRYCGTKLSSLYSISPDRSFIPEHSANPCHRACELVF